MAKNQNGLAESAGADESSGRPGGFLADEDGFDRRTIWRLGSWGVGSIGAVIVALLVYNSGAALRSRPLAGADLAKPSPQLEIAQAAERKIERLSSAIDTLNSDRDRLFARLAALEQGFESVTGSISRNASQTNAMATTTSTPAASEPAPVREPDSPGPDASTAANASTDAPLAAPAAFITAATAAAVKPPIAASSPVAASPPAIAAHDPPATIPGGQSETATLGTTKSEPGKTLHHHKEAQIVAASIPPIADAPQPPLPAQASSPETVKDMSPVPVPRTEFGVDLGSAVSIKGLRTLWQSLLKSEPKELTSLHPIIVLKENGNSIQMRLVAGPLTDAATAARICAVLSENGRTCGTTVFDGQRLAMNEDGKDSAVTPATKKPKIAPASRRRPARKSTRVEEPAQPPPPPPKPAAFSPFFSR
ncbi:hypothetical protein [Nitrobacter winogradskyi]|uniref:Outer membrane murein-binding lipoprotein Lpp n=2 Tax=Nitrobacter winogradskyi TaxID=913 RepID=A0ACC6AEH6_NITWI|nr:hypothetical protein [Nitrobacter winogradskyi]MCP1998158.1 outer membrane murein-binding lipoprotein Lpp [Nitrobacter winogradskyi]GEC15248.1 hypothetical protein NWI01_11400 [Nitrobacter winogradskyi]